jgi:F-type H+-transporting ATPase subunit b
MNNPLVRPDPGLYIWTIVTFLVLAGLLARFTWRPLLAALENRAQAIRQSLDDARQAKADIARIHEESAKILAQARADAAELVARSRADAERFRDELKEKARDEAAGLVRNAERQIEMATGRAIQQIRQEAIELSFNVASKILQRNVSKEDNERLIEETWQQIGRTPPAR